MLKKLIAIATTGIIFITFWDKVKPLIGLASFGKDADFKIKRHYGYMIEGGINGELTFLLDIDIINKSTSEVLANNLLITAYNEKNEYVGQSVPFTNNVVIGEASVTTITGLKIRTQLKNVLFDYAGPLILQLLNNKTIETGSIGRKITLDINIELNGVNINKTQIIDI